MIWLLLLSCRSSIPIKQLKSDISRLQNKIEKLEKKVAVLEQSKQKDHTRKKIARLKERQERKKKKKKNKSHRFSVQVNPLNLNGTSWDPQGKDSAPDLSIQTSISSYTCPNSHECATDPIAVPSASFPVRVYDLDEGKDEFIGKANCDQITGSCYVTGNGNLLSIEITDPVVSRKGQGIREMNANQFQLSMEMLMAIQDYPTVFKNQIQLLPHKNEQSQIDGYRLSSIKRYSIFRKMGLKNGDLVHSINGITMKALNHKKIHSSIFSSGKARIKLIRSRKEMIVEYLFYKTKED